MSGAKDTRNPDADKNALMAELDRIRTVLESAAGTSSEKGAALPGPPSEKGAAPLLCRIFGLSSFERDLLLLCAGLEMDPRFAPLCAAVHGDPNKGYPTFSLAAAVLDDPHWDAFSPSSALRYWKLLEMGGGNVLTHCPLRIDETILHYLAGVPHTDQRLLPLLEPLLTSEELAPSQRAVARRMNAIWADSPAGQIPPAFLLCGNEIEGKRAIAAETARAAGLDILVMPSYLLPSAPDDLDNLKRLWEREAALNGTVLLLDCDAHDDGDTAHERSLNHLLECLTGCVILTSRKRRRPSRRPMLSFDIQKPTTAEQRDIWNRALGPRAAELEPWIERLIFQFNLGPSAIKSVCMASVTDTLPNKQDEPDGSYGPDKQAVPAFPNRQAVPVWESCRVQARPRLEDLVQRIEPKARWADLVLPESRVEILKTIALQVRYRARVYETHGFSAKGDRGLGITALFAGSSGTGKTMAAEVLARELSLDLYRIDLSTVVNKYIGETEKNLRRVFDTAEEAGAILLFDEADALFGKRSEVKDSHDRHANIEVSYLLQRMEAYRGLAIMTTNLKDALDKAFMRRLRFIVHFPFPGPAERTAIWRGIFPAETPTDGLDPAKLARLNMSGGNIRNIALNAAFLAAAEDKPVGMEHLLQSARSEYTKLEKSLTEEEINGWI